MILVEKEVKLVPDNINKHKKGCNDCGCECSCDKDKKEGEDDKQDEVEVE